MARFWSERAAGLHDRTAGRHRLHRSTPPKAVEPIVALRRAHWTGKRVEAELGVSATAVSRILGRLGLSRARDLEPAEPVRRYEWARLGELIHLDLRKLGRSERIGDRSLAGPRSDSRREQSQEILEAHHW